MRRICIDVVAEQNFYIIIFIMKKKPSNKLRTGD